MEVRLYLAAAVSVQINDAGYLAAGAHVGLVVAADEFVAALVGELDFGPGYLEAIFPEELGA